MKKLLAIVILITGFMSQVQAQCVPLGTAQEAGITLKFNSEEGTNASAVVWNPLKKVYYAIIAGNMSYPLETFDANGNSIASVEAGNDMRGLWWNPSTNTLEGNTYGGTWVSYQLYDGNATESSNEIKADIYQPNEQSVATFDPLKKLVLYYSEGVVYTFKRSSGKAGKQITLKDIPADLLDINSYSMIYTGCKGYEYGVLNYTAGEVYLFNTKGAYTAKVKLPESAVVGYSFWLSYANNKLWLYNTETRAWTGYVICK